MKTILLSFIAIFFSIAIYSQTPVPPGDISGTWTLAGSPYLINGETTVPDGMTLTIEPGVVVEWQGSYKMNVQGQILAEGTEADSIIFTAKYTFDGFKSIRFDNTPIGNDTSRFTHCVFRYGRAYGEYPDNCGGAIAGLYYDKFVIDHCLFAYNKANEIDIGGNPGGGAIALWTSSPIIWNSTFTDNESKYGGAIMCYIESNPLIYNNVFTGNMVQKDGGAIMCWIDSDPPITYNLFYENTAGKYGGAIDLNDNCSPDITNNTIVDNVSDVGGGITVYGSCSPNIRNTILWGNTAFEGNQVCIRSDDCEPNFYYSDIEGGWEAFGGEPFTGDYDNNIDEDPVFIDPSSGDYRLVRDESPCINAGDPDPIYNNPDGTRNDMGAIWPSWWSVGIESNESPVEARHASPLKLECFPNPADRIMNIEYRLTPVPQEAGNDEVVGLRVYDIHGQEMKRLVNKTQPAGEYTVQFDASDLPAGIYLIRLQIGSQTVVKKIIKF